MVLDAGFPGRSRTSEQYRRANRSVWVQELEMPPARRLELQRFLEWNERPENRFYHYDYYRDNCSTRVRDALDRALGGRIRRADRRTAHRHDLPLPYPSPHRQRSPDLHRAAARAGAAGRPADLRVGGDVSPAGDAGAPAERHRPGADGRPAPAGPIRADAVRVHRHASATGARRAGWPATSSSA